MPRAYCWRCERHVNASPSGSDIMGGIVIQGPGPFDLIAPIRKRYQEHFCSVCGTRVITEDQIAENRAREELKNRTLISPISAKIIAVAFIAFVVLMLIPVNRDQAIIVGDSGEWNSLSLKQKHAFCASLAVASSKGDSEQVYFDALNEEYTLRGGLKIAAVVRHIDPGNRLLPEHQ